MRILGRLRISGQVIATLQGNGRWISRERHLESVLNGQFGLSGVSVVDGDIAARRLMEASACYGATIEFAAW